jgi:hypothetical protein
MESLAAAQTMLADDQQILASCAVAHQERSGNPSSIRMLKGRGMSTDTQLDMVAVRAVFGVLIVSLDTPLRMSSNPFVPY